MLWLRSNRAVSNYYIKLGPEVGLVCSSIDIKAFFMYSITKESIVDVYGVIRTSPVAIEGCNPDNVELHICKVFVISVSSPVLPFQIEDAMRPDGDDEDVRFT